MTASGNRISHLCQMVNVAVWNLHLACKSGEYGYLQSLQEQVNDGGYVTDKTIEAMELERAATDLRKLADSISGIRQGLIDNYNKREA